MPGRLECRFCGSTNHLVRIFRAGSSGFLVPVDAVCARCAPPPPPRPRDRTSGPLSDFRAQTRLGRDEPVLHDLPPLTWEAGALAPGVPSGYKLTACRPMSIFRHLLACRHAHYSRKVPFEGADTYRRRTGDRNRSRPPALGLLRLRGLLPRQARSCAHTVGGRGMDTSLCPAPAVAVATIARLTTTWTQPGQPGVFVFRLTEKTSFLRLRMPLARTQAREGGNRAGPAIGS